MPHPNATLTPRGPTDEKKETAAGFWERPNTLNRTGFNRGKEIGKGTLLSCRSNTPTNSRPAPWTS